MKDKSGLDFWELLEEDDICEIELLQRLKRNISYTCFVQLVVCAMCDFTELDKVVKVSVTIL